MGKREGYGFSFAKIETDWKVGLLFCYTLISGSRKGVAMSKFLSYEDRLIISQRIQENASFGAIAKELGKDRTTIAKEIRKYSYDKKSGRPGYPYNPCKYRNSCKAKKSAVRMDARISQPINAACVRNVPSIALILKRRSVLLRGNHLTFTTAAGNSPDAPF